MDINKDIIETKGIVLSEIRYRESSRIIDLFTKKRGRINIFVSGALKPNNNLMLATEKLVESDFILQRTKNRFYIKSADILNSNLELGNNPKKYIIGDMISELLIKTMPENLVDEVIYELTITTINFLKSNSFDVDPIRLGFMLKYISLIGFRPHLSKCVVCETSKFKEFYFSPKDGGLICENCLEIAEDYDKLNKIELEAMIKLLLSKYEDYENFNLNKETIKKIDDIIYKYVIYNTELGDLESRIKYKKLFGI